MAGTQNAVGWLSTVGVGGFQANDATAQQQVGVLAMDGLGNVYRYVLINAADAIDCADGQVVYMQSTSTYDVSADQSAALGARPIGVGIGEITAGQYGWVMVAGIHDAILTDGGVAVGEFLIGHTVDGEVDTMAAGEEHLVIGQALSTDSGSPESTPAKIYCL